MPLTDAQRAHLHPQITDLRRHCEGIPTPERATLLRHALAGADANPTWAEWEEFVRAELGSLPAALAGPGHARQVGAEGF